MSLSILEKNLLHKILTHSKIFTKSPCLNIHIKRYKHLVKFSNGENLHITRITQMSSVKLRPKNLVTPSCVRSFCLSCVKLKPENDDGGIDIKNDAMLKAWMAEISKDFEDEKPKIIVLTEKGKEKNKDQNIDKVIEKDILNDVETKSSDISEWVDYYGIDDAEVTNSQGERKTVKGVPNKNSEDMSNTESDYDSETSDGEKFSCSESEGEQGLFSSDSDSDTEKSSAAENLNFSRLKTEDEKSPKLLLNDQISFGSETRMEDISGKYIKLHDDVSNFEYDMGEYVSDSDTECNTKARTDEIDEFADDAEYEEIDDFPDDFEEATSDIGTPWVPPVNLNRGKEGVFDLPDLVTVLKSENAEDIVVIKIPEAYQFGDYMVIASAKSTRHLRAVMSNMNKVYKMKKYPSDRQVDIEGLLDSQNWLAADLGNIILHVFLPKARKLYDLETLWTVGEEFDDKFKEDDLDFGVGNANQMWLESLSEKWKD